MSVKELELKTQSNKVRQLLDKAKERKYLTLNEILNVFPEAEGNLSQLDDLFSYLYRSGIEIYNNEAEVKEAEEDEAKDFALDSGSEESESSDESRSSLSNIPVEDAIGLYLAKMSQVPLLTPDEEVSLAKRLEKGNKAREELSDNGHSPSERDELKWLIQDGERAREHLIAANTRLVVSIAKKYRGLGLPFQDLIQAGNVGLIKAADRFDYKRGYKFGTYATWWIRQAITRALSQQGRIIRLPVHLGDRLRKLYKVAQRIEQDLGRRPTPKEIADEIEGLDTEEARWMLRVSKRPMSIHEPVGDEEDSSEFGDFIEDDEALSPPESAELQLLSEDLERMLATLLPREARVLRMRFGLDGDRKHTLKEVGEKLGVTRERARQIERRALSKLRHPRYRRKLVGYLT